MPKAGLVPRTRPGRVDPRPTRRDPRSGGSVEFKAVGQVVYRYESATSSETKDMVAKAAVGWVTVIFFGGFIPWNKGLDEEGLSLE